MKFPIAISRPVETSQPAQAESGVEDGNLIFQHESLIVRRPSGIASLPKQLDELLQSDRHRSSLRVSLSTAASYRAPRPQANAVVGNRSVSRASRSPPEWPGQDRSIPWVETTRLETADTLGTVLQALPGGLTSRRSEQGLHLLGGKLRQDGGAAWFGPGLIDSAWAPIEECRKPASSSLQQ